MRMNLGKNKAVLQAILVGGILIFGGVITGVLMLITEAPLKEDYPVIRPLVEVVLAQKRDVQVEIKGHGTVRSTVKTQVGPEVSGRVVFMHPQMFAGGFISSGQSRGAGV